MYETVVLATDGSEHATAAETHALDLAAQHDASLQAVAVVETRTGYDNAIVDPDRVRQQLREDATETLEALEGRARDRGVSVDTSVVEGIPAEAILAAAEEKDADIIVMGARGRSTFKTVLLGSTAEAVLGRAGVPVVLVGEPGAV